MKIHRFSLTHIRLSYRRPINWFNSSESACDLVLLHLVSDEGGVGVAEAPVRPTWCGKTVSMMFDAVAHLFLPALAGVDLDDNAAVHKVLSRFPDNHLPIMLIDNAIAVLRADSAGVPLWRALGGAQHVETSWCVTRRSVDDMTREAVEMTGRYGFRTLKIKGGQGWDTDRAVVRAIREAVGPEITLTVDANGAYSQESAQRYVAMLAEETVAIAEDPCPLDEAPFLRQLTTDSPIPVLVDMPCLTVADVHRLAAAGACAVSIKPGRVGVSEAARMATAAREDAVAVCSGTYGESALGSLISLAFASTFTAPLTVAEQSFFLAFEQGILSHEIGVADGVIELPNTTSATSVDEGLLQSRTICRSSGTL